MYRDPDAYGQFLRRALSAARADSVWGDAPRDACAAQDAGADTAEVSAAIDTALLQNAWPIAFALAEHLLGRLADLTASERVLVGSAVFRLVLSCNACLADDLLTAFRACFRGHAGLHNLALQLGLRRLDREAVREARAGVLATHPAENRFRQHCEWFLVGNDAMSQIGQYVERHDLRAPMREADAVFLIGADRQYLVRYFDGWLSSICNIRASGLNAAVHVHFLDTGSDDRTAILLKLRNCGFRPTWTTQDTAATIAPEARRTLYACARYAIAARVLAAWQRPVVISDVDAYLHPRVADFTSLDGADAVFLMRSATYMPHQRYLAGLTILHPTALGHGFARLVRGYIRWGFDAQRPQWFFDQVALYACAFHLLSDGNAGFRARTVERHDQDVATFL